MDLTNYTATPVSKLRDRFNEARFDPTMLIKAEIETVEEITNNKAVLVDATNPAVLVLEMAAVLASNCIQEAAALLRKQYPSLANTVEELYYHMSDEDYLNRFASAATGNFTFSIQVSDLISQMVYDPVEKTYKVEFPRDSTITVDGVTFTTLYPIVIRRYSNGVVQISYDPSIVSPVSSLKNTIIELTTRRAANGDEWIFFTIPALQTAITPSYFVIERTYNFRKSIVYTDDFFHARVFYQNTNTAKAWVEILTTHSDQVFDISKPTALLKVLEDTVLVEIPAIYITSGLISGQLRVDLYTTKGELSLNLQNYRQDAFVVDLKAIDEERDLNDYTNAMAGVSYYCYSLDVVSGGKSAVDFETLRERVIYNSVGPQALPITNFQQTASVENNGFQIVKDIDVVTNRVFQATRELPTPKNTKLITPANIGIATFTSSLEELVVKSKVVDNGSRATILSKALFKSTNGKLQLLSESEIGQLYALNQTALVDEVNGGSYLYTPFYTVFDASGDEFGVRSYALDQPYAKDLNFVRQNQTLQLFVNTGSYSITKLSDGFTLKITTKSGNYYQNLDNGQIGVQLAFNPKGESTYAYINGVLEAKGSDGERTFSFKIETNHDLNSEHLLAITNSQVQGITDYTAWIDLTTEFSLIHHTNSLTENFTFDETDLILGKFLLTPGHVGNNLEKLTIHFGDALKNLWSRSRSFKTDRIYKTHQVDVPLFYEEVVFDINPSTGSSFTIENNEIVYHYLHKVGDPVLDANGNQVYKYRVGDVMLDANGDPIYDVDLKTGRECDLLVVDARYYFATDTATVSYRKEIETILTDWIVDGLADIAEELLEQTRVYFYPKTTLGVVRVYTPNDAEDYLNAEQVLTVSLYAPKAIYENLGVREKLESSTIEILSTYIGQSRVNVSEIEDYLRVYYADSVSSVRLSGLGGAANYQVVRLVNPNTKLCIKKELVVQPDKTTLVSDAVVFEWNKMD
jgi:hypothetical protein